MSHELVVGDFLTSGIVRRASMNRRMCRCPLLSVGGVSNEEFYFVREAYL